MCNTGAELYLWFLWAPTLAFEGERLHGVLVWNTPCSCNPGYCKEPSGTETSFQQQLTALLLTYPFLATKLLQIQEHSLENIFLNQKGQKRKEGENCFTFPIVACFAIEASEQASKQVADLCFLRKHSEMSMDAHTHSQNINLDLLAAKGSFLLCFSEKAENHVPRPILRWTLCSWDNRVRLRRIQSFWGEFATLEKFVKFTKPNTPGAKSFWKTSPNLFENDPCAYMHAHGHPPTTRSSDCTCSLKAKVYCFITLSWSFWGETHVALGKWHSWFTLMTKLLQL